MLKNKINEYFSLILLLFSGLGFIIPYPGKFASYAILCFLFLIIFSSFFQFKLNRKIFINYSFKSLVFSLIRFFVLPVAVYFLVLPFSLYYAFGLFFLLSLPTAVSSPAITKIVKGDVNLSLLILIYSSFLISLFLPLLTALLASKEMHISHVKLFTTLVTTIILPFLLHLPLRKSKAIQHFFNENLSFITVCSLSVIFMLAIAKNKSEITGNYHKIIEYAIIAFIMYTSLYFGGWIYSSKQMHNRRVTYAISSGLNNIGLGVSLATLYLTPQVTIFFIIAQITWVLLIVPLKKIFSE